MFNYCATSTDEEILQYSSTERHHFPKSILDKSWSQRTSDKGGLCDGMSGDVEKPINMYLNIFVLL